MPYNLFDPFACPYVADEATYLIMEQFGHDGDLWIDMARFKTKKKESVKVLPGAPKLMEKFKPHPKCIKKGRIIPMPTNEHWNRCLKKMGKELGFNIKMDGQSAGHAKVQ